MTMGQGAAETDVKIRTLRRAWMQQCVFGGMGVPFAIVWMTGRSVVLSPLLASSRLRFSGTGVVDPDVRG